MHTALRLIVYILCMGTGVLMLLLLLFPQQFVPYVLDYLKGLQEGHGFWTPMMLGIVQILMPLSLALRWLSKRRFSREISYMTANGRVSVNLQVMEEALSRAVNNEPQVKHVVVRMYEDRIRRMVVIQAVLTLWAEENITAANEKCQKILSQRFAELMPEQRSVQVHLSVNRLRHRQSTEFHKALCDREDSDTHVITPGLVATDGLADNEAGRDLLQKTKRRKHSEDGYIYERPETVYAEKPQKQLPRTEKRVQTDRIAQLPTGSSNVSTASARTEEDPFGDMYQGPVYAVPEDDDVDLTGGSLPIDK